MSQENKIVLEGGVGEIVEKKSRFIATVKAVNNEEDAIKFIEETKKKYWDARHNCSAFVIGENNALKRFSDDGEPQGTAGKPILEVLEGSGIINICVVVTRYFGGTLLGTGGLVRAYSQSTQEGIKNSKIATTYKGQQILIKTDYNGFGKIQYIMGQMEIEHEVEYTDIVVVKASVKLDDIDRFTKKITEVTAGKASITPEKDIVIIKEL